MTRRPQGAAWLHDRAGGGKRHLLHRAPGQNRFCFLADKGATFGSGHTDQIASYVIQAVSFAHAPIRDQRQADTEPGSWMENADKVGIFDISGIDR